MNPTTHTPPHGGKLLDLRVGEERAALLKAAAAGMKDLRLNDRQLCDLEMLATGAFSPLAGFMVRSEYESVLEGTRLPGGLLWPLPVCLDVHADLARDLEAGQSLALRDPEGFLLAVLSVEEIWPLDREREALAVFGTRDITHPGVRHLYYGTGDHYVGGGLEVLSLPLHFDFRQLRRSPAEVRALFAKLGWQRVIGFQTRNVIHRPQFEMTVRAMRQAKANLLALPIAGMARPGDFDHYTRVRCYRAVSRSYPPDAFILSLLPLHFRMAGPRDAVLHLILSKNYGCSHAIVGHDHAAPGTDGNGGSFYGSEDTLAQAAGCAPELGIEVLPFKEMVYLPFEDEYRTVDQVPENVGTISLSGSDLRERVRTGRRIPEWASFPAVIAELTRAYPPPSRQGFTVFLTGLSGAGKSTIAKILYSRFLEAGERPATLLDGDIVRRHLSSELSFSREHRDINVRRIGFVAGEITKNRGIAICAPIAPYAQTRLEIREAVEACGGFIEVHVATPLEVCERRDRKGMYAKARAGLIKGYTGIDDPYEEPEAPEVRIDASHITPDEAAQEILLFLGQKGYL